MKASKEEYLEALSKASEDVDAYHTMISLINEHFAMIEHMKTTSLYDVYTYEMDLTNILIEPSRILANENEDLKKEVNDLRKKLGLSKKYK